MKCPECKNEIDFEAGETLFCEYCGTRLEMETESAAEAFLEDAGEDAGCEVIMSDCRCLKLRYNVNTFLMSNKIATLKLQLTPLNEDLRSVMIFYTVGQGDLKELHVHHLLKKDRSFNVTENLPLGNESGQITFTFYIGCCLEDAVNYYSFSVTHFVYDPEDSREEFSQKIIMNINAQDAADINLQTGDFAKNITGKNKQDMIASLCNMPDNFVEQSLVRIPFDPIIMEIMNETGKEPEAADKLMLKWNGNKIFLLSGRKTALGRTSEKSDLLIRRPGFPENAKPNRTVSRLHAVLEYLGDNVEMEDRSAFGTWLNGQKLENKLIMPPEGVVEFGDVHWQMRQQYCNGGGFLGHKMCKTCLKKRVKSMTFSGAPEDKEHYLFVWQCCELGMVLPELAGWKIFFRDGTFIVRTPDGVRSFLSPGTKLECNGQVIEVLFFQQ